jgi:hypothetical protein
VKRCAEGDTHEAGIEVDSCFKDFRDKFDTMVKTINGNRTLTFESLLDGTNLPFTTKVMEFPLPSKFKMQKVKAYDSNKNNLDHIETYKAYMFSKGPRRDHVSALPKPL